MAWNVLLGFPYVSTQNMASLESGKKRLALPNSSQKIDIGRGMSDAKPNPDKNNDEIFVVPKTAAGARVPVP
jgi:hypothetical protein